MALACDDYDRHFGTRGYFGVIFFIIIPRQKPKQWKLSLYLFHNISQSIDQNSTFYSGVAKSRCMYHCPEETEKEIPLIYFLLPLYEFASFHRVPAYTYHAEANHSDTCESTLWDINVSIFESSCSILHS